MKEPIAIFWFRRDLRLHDNAGLYHALKSGYKVLPVFIFDTDILDDLNDKHDRRVQFIRNALMVMQEELVELKSSLHVLHTTPQKAFEELIKQYSIVRVYTNHDYEPYAKTRDEQLGKWLASHDISLHTYKDQVIFEKGEVSKDNGEPYTVYTPYSKKWKSELSKFFLKSYPTDKYFKSLMQLSPKRIPSMEALGFKEMKLDIAIPPQLDVQVARNYDKKRDLPAAAATTHMSVHLRFGTVSVRELASDAHKLNETLLNELIWREFFMMILWHFPHTVSEAFKPAYDKIKWRYAEKEFEKWCKGETGFPIVDAGMRELNETGYMHNRVRLIVSSFLCKDLLIDWRWGEAYFAEKLLDYEMSSNVGNWQWAAGCGCDAAPYFRVFNPQLQTEKFDPKLEYVRKWVPEVDSLSYPPPMLDHAKAKERCLQAYKTALS